MITDSTRISIYEYLDGVFEDVTDNLYNMSMPEETTANDAENGFCVINVGNVYDESEFSCDAYGWVRCQIAAYVPKRTRGRLDKEKYKAFEDAIIEAIVDNLDSENESGYYIMQDSVLSMEGDEERIKGNQYHMFIKSFIVVIDQESNKQQTN